MCKRKTQEQFVKEVYELVGDEYNVLSDYVNSYSKIRFIHNVCGTIYEAIPNSFLQGNRCPNCRILKFTKSHESFISEIESKFGDIYEFKTKYKTMSNKITVIHKVCNYEFETTPATLLNSKKPVCPNCNNVIRLTQEIFEDRVFALVGNEYTIISEFIDSSTKILMQHNVKNCNYIFEVKPKNFLNINSRCPVCSPSTTWTTDIFKEFLYRMYGAEFTVIGEYIDNFTHVTIKHNNCNHTFETTPSNLKQGYIKVCPWCADEINNINYKDKVFKKYGNEYEIIGEYINSATPLMIKHNDCGRIFERIIYNFYYLERGCPCKKIKSTGEHRISIFFDEHDVKYKQQHSFDDCRNKNPLPFDFAIFKENDHVGYLIEYDGEGHFYPVDFAGKGKEWAQEQLKLIQLRDSIKNDYCRKNEIKLFRIPYWELDNIEIILDKIINGEHIEVDETSFFIKL